MERKARQSSAEYVSGLHIDNVIKNDIKNTATSIKTCTISNDALEFARFITTNLRQA